MSVLVGGCGAEVSSSSEMQQEVIEDVESLSSGESSKNVSLRCGMSSRGFGVVVEGDDQVDALLG